MTSTPTPAVAERPRPPGDRLRSGAGADTTRSVLDGAPVVLRHLELGHASAGFRDRVRRDLGVAARARSSNLLPCRVLHADADGLTLVRPHVDGLDIRAWARTGPDDETMLRAVRELFGALATLHRHGLVHGGVKPANALLDGGTGRLVLVDAVVSRTQLAGAPLVGGVGQVGGAGGPGEVGDESDTRYLSPEQAGVVHRAVGPATDLYAAGWTLLDAIAARAGRDLPRPEPCATRASADLVLHRLEVPPRWRPLLRRLLAPMPEDRFGTAADVLAVLANAPGRRAVPARGRVGTPVADVAPRVLDDPPMIGRSAERAQLAEVLDAVRAGRSAAACLSGQSGLGKSRLLDELADRAEAAGIPVLRGAAFDETARRPLAPFREVFEQVADRLADQPQHAARLAAGLGGTLPAVTALAPELAAALGGEHSGGPWAGVDPVDGGGAVAALAGLLHELGAPGHPGLLLVDDCQWADELSWKLLSALIRGSERRAGTPAHLAVVLSMRAEALPEVLSWGSDVLRTVRLDPMPGRETHDLLQAAGDRLPAAVVDYVVGHAAGSPLFALAILRGLWDAGVLRGAPGRWTVDVARLREPGIDGMVGEPTGDPPLAFLDAPVGQLPAPAHRAVRQAAVLGRRFRVPLLAAAVRRDPSATLADVVQAERRGMLRPVPGAADDQWEFSHDRVREAVLRAIDDDTLAELHAAAARALAERHVGPGAGRDPRDAAGTRPGADAAAGAVAAPDYELAYHLDRSGQPGRALPHALAAAEQALRHKALHVAEANFRIAAGGLADPLVVADDRVRFRLHEGMGTVHMLQGRYDRAAAEFELAYRTAAGLGRLEPARVAVSLGELAFKRGDVDAARTWFGHARRRLGHPDIRRPAAGWAVVETLRLVLALLVRWPARRSRRPRPADHRLELAARLDNRCGYLSWFTRRPSVNVALAARAIRLALVGRGHRELAHAYALGSAMLAGLVPALAGWALRLADLSLRLRTRSGDEWGEAHSQHFRGFVLHAAGRYSEAVAALDAAVERFDVLGDRWEQAAANWQKALCLYRRGLLHEAGSLARETYGAGNRIGDRISAGTALAVWARCLPLEVGVDTITRELHRPELDAHTETLLRTALGWKLLAGGDLDGAVEELVAADRTRRRAGLRNHFLAPTATTLAQALRLHRDRNPAWAPQRGRRAGRRLRRALRRAWLGSLCYPAERCGVLRERSARRFAGGRRGYAGWLLRRARRESARRGAEGELAACELFAAQAAGGRPGTDRQRDADELCARLRLRVEDGLVQARSLPVIRSVAETARHRAVLEAARRIVAAEGRDRILDELRAAVLATTPAEEVSVRSESETDSAADFDAGAAGSGAEPGSGTGSGATGLAADPTAEPMPGAAAGARSRTESVVRPVAAGLPGTLTVRAELPLGEATGHEQSIDVLATLAGAVLERQALREESARRIAAVQEAERGRIARDLHDELGHLFAGVIEGLAVLDRDRGRPGDDRVQGLRELARHGIRTVRSVAWTLRPEGLDDLGVVACVEQLVDDCERRFGIEIELTAQVGRPMPPAVETAVFRVAQEALTNIGRHSRATEASVLLVAGVRTMRVVVEDDGVGFDPDAPRSGSLGLAGMRERAALVGGRLEVQARPGAGVMVMMEVPLDDERPDVPGSTEPVAPAAPDDAPPWPGCDDGCRDL